MGRDYLGIIIVDVRAAYRRGVTGPPVCTTSDVRLRVRAGITCLMEVRGKVIFVKASLFEVSLMIISVRVLPSNNIQFLRRFIAIPYKLYVRYELNML